MFRPRRRAGRRFPLAMEVSPNRPPPRGRGAPTPPASPTPPHPPPPSPPPFRPPSHVLSVYRRWPSWVRGKLERATHGASHDGLAVLDSPVRVVGSALSPGENETARSDRHERSSIPSSASRSATAAAHDRRPSILMSARPFSTCPLDAIGDSGAVAVTGAGHVYRRGSRRTLLSSPSPRRTSLDASKRWSHHMAPVPDPMSAGRSESSTGMPVSSVPGSGGSSLRETESATGLSRSMCAVTLRECPEVRLDSGTGEADALSSTGWARCTFHRILSTISVHRAFRARHRGRRRLDNRSSWAQPVSSERCSMRPVPALHLRSRDRVGDGLHLLAAQWNRSGGPGGRDSSRSIPRTYAGNAPRPPRATCSCHHAAAPNLRAAGFTPDLGQPEGAARAAPRALERLGPRAVVGEFAPPVGELSGVAHARE